VPEFLEFNNISKSFVGVRALTDVSFHARSGRVVALLGENGAGKSTLLKILAGDLRADKGAIRLDERPLDFRSPNDAIRAGVSVIYQECQMVDMLSVMENIFAGDLPKNRFGLLDRAKLRRDAQEMIDFFGLPLDPREPVARISVAHRQMVEIMRAYRRDSAVIAFDEPTAGLTDVEISALFRLIRRLKSEGKIILYVSHRLAEIFEVTDDIVVLKDGSFVTQLKTAETDEQSLIRAMVGRDIGDTYLGLSRNDSHAETVLEVKNLVTSKLKNVSFSLRGGEIIGFAGLVGAGRTELARAVFGADPILAGEIRLEGKPVRFKDPADAIAAGIALCPEDRKEQGLILYRSIKENVSIPILSRIRRFLFLTDARRTTWQTSPSRGIRSKPPRPKSSRSNSRAGTSKRSSSVAGQTRRW
jgi:ABC-type sugar transport system ATPase subunit